MAGAALLSGGSRLGLPSREAVLVARRRADFILISAQRMMRNE